MIARRVATIASLALALATGACGTSLHEIAVETRLAPKLDASAFERVLVAGILSARFVFIDGRTGAVLQSEQYREQVFYGDQQNTPALASYFELMDRLLPEFLTLLTTQTVRTTRLLLR